VEVLRGGYLRPVYHGQNGLRTLKEPRPIYLMFIRVLLSVEFCFTLKTYLKGAPFYNASAEGKVGHAVGEDMEALQKPKGGDR
jgi:hypothetical protein